MQMNSDRPDGTARRTKMRPLSQKAQQLNRLATVIAYHRFCCENSRYQHGMANQLRIMDWIDERRIEMVAEGRPHWVPSMDDFERAMRDCWDDLVKPIPLDSLSLGQTR
jgi:hypothetical protein